MGVVDISYAREQEQAAARNPYGLTRREIALSRLLRKGTAEAAITAQLGIDLTTFERLQAGLMDKLRAQSDAQLRHLLCVLTAERLEPSQIVYLDDFRTSVGVSSTGELDAEGDVIFVPDADGIDERLTTASDGRWLSKLWRGVRSWAQDRALP